MRLKWTVFGRLFPTTRSITWSRPMVALTSALRDRSVTTGAFYSVSFCHRRADESAAVECKRTGTDMIRAADGTRRIGVRSAVRIDPTTKRGDAMKSLALFTILGLCAFATDPGGPNWGPPVPQA